MGLVIAALLFAVAASGAEVDGDKVTYSGDGGKNTFTIPAHGSK